jgi:hypothetical protein
VRLSRSRRLWIYGVGVGLWCTGALWLLFHYFVVHNGDFGPGPHPIEPWWLKLHGAFAFTGIWMFGLLWGVHVVKGWGGERRRLSGGLLVGLTIWLTLSGYLLYYAGNEDLRSVISLLHWVIGLACPASFLVHRFGWQQTGRIIHDDLAADANGSSVVMLRRGVAQRTSTN